MSFKTKLRVILTPSIWYRLYSTDNRVDRLIRMLVEHKDQVKIVSTKNLSTKNPCWLTIQFRQTFIQLWTGNRWYAYLSTIMAGDDPHPLNMISQNVVPSREAALMFYGAFGHIQNRGPVDTLLDHLEQSKDS